MPGTTNTKGAARKSGTGSAAQAFAWGNTLPCVATYKVLEGDTLLNQFEDASTPFADAGSMKMSSLLYFPHTTTNSDIIDMLADQMARKFLTLIQKNFTITIHDPNERTGDVIDKVSAIFADADKTLADLAKVISDEIDFPASNS